jgi:hypothetical protein
VDNADWDAAVFEIARAADEMQVLGRCLAVGEHLAGWRAEGGVLPGSLASDALDQALGLLDEMAKGRAASLAATVSKLLDVLPPSQD